MEHSEIHQICLARNRQIEELEKIVADTKSQLEELRNRKDEIATAIALGSDELAEIREKLQKKYIEQNTARLNVEEQISKDVRANRHMTG